MSMFLLTAGIDYTTVMKEVTFAPNMTKEIVTIPILDDTVLQEPNISFSVAIIFNENIIAKSVITIVNDDYGELIMLGYQ